MVKFELDKLIQRERERPRFELIVKPDGGCQSIVMRRRNAVHPTNTDQV